MTRFAVGGIGGTGRIASASARDELGNRGFFSSTNSPQAGKRRESSLNEALAA